MSVTTMAGSDDKEHRRTPTALNLASPENHKSYVPEMLRDTHTSDLAKGVRFFPPPTCFLTSVIATVPEIRASLTPR